ncbi:MAG: S-methyl-5'-thioinosine phosphorylase [Candidatus Thiodiazotropha taylori]|nr:S-methyl-5'-thioinosine phosphorylase [Candidatus Thiodiazotropha taylori]MCG7894208.1 S-methyl-5'-thioinosine phosphorylase [Candidatus Thiodiazotropha taylori]MCG7911918.1 S-methyl-5'-thioinosine phosphorylase [Candidatus Thiodiazotropha taylori]MCG7917712.1 S-methyl-5'-thioinosine phosphorylase [Candidatus Thiodiazotropha taylori]MCG7942702.1 S-methyl-5'-thioinosine phosphorylase [Candidatus Thiodiazotropha taylori]
MTKLAIIGGTGLNKIPDLEITHREVCHTPFGEPSAALTHGRIAGSEVVFLPRHGATHTIPPHRVNYRANLWALHHIGVDSVIGVAAVGGITSEMAPGRIVIPDQIIDYTFGRDHTIYEKDLQHVTHIDFTYPYCQQLRQRLIDAANNSGVGCVDAATYGATQGPRLETAAEVTRMERDGCDIVGMTGMPEAALAREFELCYASCAVVANWGAGKQQASISMKDIEKNLIVGMEQARKLLTILLRESA